ncbi:MAG TPA: hypothetical protein VFT82_02320 [Candidatus Paceibacterota bacterium]|nr:hypothetical protein [Candidatus Paceibacterota bacterium]
MKKNLIINVCGWYGVIALIGAYAALSYGVWTANDSVFQVFNVTGSLVIVIKALAQKDWPAVVLNIIWAVIGFVALITFIK